MNDAISKIAFCLAAAALSITQGQKMVAARDLTNNERAMFEDAITSALEKSKAGPFQWLPYTLNAEVYDVQGSFDFYCGYVGSIPFEALVHRDSAGEIKEMAVGVGDEDDTAQHIIGRCQLHGYRGMQAP